MAEEEKKIIGPNGEGRWENGVGDAQFIMNYYISRKVTASYYEIDYEDFIFALDKYGNIPMNIYYFYDQYQDCTDILVDLRQVYKKVKAFSCYEDYDDFLSAVVSQSSGYNKLSFVGRIARGDALDTESEETDMLWIKMLGYPHVYYCNSLAHFAGVLADLIDYLNHMANRKIDSRTLERILKDTEKINVNFLFWLLVAGVVLGVTGIVVGIIKGWVWMWILGIIIALIFGALTFLTTGALIHQKNQFKEQDFKGTKCWEVSTSRFDK